MDIKKKEALEKIIQLTNKALANPQISSDKKLNGLLLKIREKALSGEVFYDLKKELQSTVSGFTLRNNFQTPGELLDLLALIRTPKGWSGF
ncbi:bacteriocin immunity protein [Enterococcus faecalis]|uniref:bacteriocin immunity protein n=1 Tax=Enterococcus TaxID=1350 RepID=UPI000B3D4C83|nr:bacteriocin immunity protein [Enterococcus faecalis]EGO8197565.1 bacteriocin immunity protein [Enterococcus faecalis]MBG9437437.1 bacteriocin immunity protein [Enterococcus faecalis]MBG9440219.1 bacteriocin immunity protein [Enterococcus faecalis]MBG9442993.1 bacteriocin immunity protein [Enterococcus faecalis]MDL4860589.1 bacteriocin immunity protein [Enterococcus faecalis]